MTRRVLSWMVFGSSIAIAAATTARAQSFPQRPMTIVVPYAAGGPTDTLARTLMEPMARSLGQPVIIENIAGAAGSIGVERVVRAAPDGYTLNIGNWGTNVLNGVVHNIKFDLLADLEPISLLASNPHLIVSRSTVPASNLGELIAWVRANQDKIASGHSGAGSGSHISGLFFQRQTGTQFPFVAHRGAGPIMQSLMAGHIDLFFDQASNTLPHLSSGKIRVYAVAGSHRLPTAPDIPTVDEAGLPGFHVSIWHGLWAPRATPGPTIEKLRVAVASALDDAAVRARLSDLGQELPSAEKRTPAALRAHQRAEIEKWWPLIRSANLMEKK